MVRQKCKVHKSGSAKCIIQFCKMEDSIENAATTTNQPLSHQLSLENRRVSDRLRRQGESDEQRQQRLGARRASRRLESHDQHEQRLQNRRVSDRLRRDQESQEEHDQRLQRRRERDALARQEESQQQHEQRLERRRVRNPSCLQTTWELVVSHASSHTVPQTLVWQISTRDRLRRHQESNEQRLQNRRESVRTRRQQQTVEHRQHNLALRRFRHKTVEQFLADPLPNLCLNIDPLPYS